MLNILQQVVKGEFSPSSTEVSSTNFESFWKTRILAVQSLSQLISLLEVLVNIDAGEPRQDRQPEECPFIIVSDWTVRQLLPSKQLPFPDATSAAELYRQHLRVPFWLLFIACGLPEILASQISSLPQEERSGANKLLSQILQRILVTPFGDPACADRLASAMLGWKSENSGGLPPRVLCLELIKITSYEWEPAVARCQAEMFACEAALLQAQLDEHLRQAKSADDVEVDKDSQAPSSSAESMNDPQRDTYLILTMSLDRQRLHIDMGQQLLNLCVLERRLKSFATKRDVEHRKWQSLMLAGWKAKLMKEMERVNNLRHSTPEEIVRDFELRSKTMEKEILEKMEQTKVKKDEISAARESLRARKEELENELKKVSEQIEKLTEEEVCHAESLCQSVSLLDSSNMDLDREMFAALAKAEEIRAIEADLRALMSSQPECVEDLNVPERDVDSMPETTPDFPPEDSQHLLRTGNYSPPSVTTERTGAATCGEHHVDHPELHQRITQMAERLLEAQLPAFMSTERAFVQFCCEKLRSAGMRARHPPQKGVSSMDVKRWQLYRPLLAQTVLTIDRLARSTELAMSVLFEDQTELTRMEASKDIFMKGYQECKELIAENSSTIF